MERILIIEDEQRISAFIAKGLKAHGFTPTVVADGITGLDHATTGDYDLAVLDIGLPGLDGMTLLRRLRDSGSRMPVMILTAQDTEPMRAAALAAGADEYMTKPFRFGDMLTRIRSLTGDEAAGATPQSR